MTKLEALTDLLAKVEAGEQLNDSTDAAMVERAFGSSMLVMTFAEAYALESTDAAMVLHKAVLPSGFDFEKFSLSGEIVLKRDRPIDRFYGFADGNPARAWLIAIIKALIAMEKNDDQ